MKIWTFEDPAFAAIYRCPVCTREHSTAADALNCANSTPKPSVKPGDILDLGGRYGWYDGDERWVKSHGPDEHNGMKLYHFWWVVTAVDEEIGDGWSSHRPRYHVMTKALKNGHEEGFIGYTFDHGHIRPKRAKKPPQFVIDDSKKLIGKIATHLL